MSGKFILRSSTDQFTFTLSLAGSLAALLTSPSYTRKESAQDAIVAVRQSSGVPFRFRRRRSKNGQRFFVLQSSTGKVVGTSEMYSSTTAREEAIAAVRRYARAAALEDQTQAAH